MLILFIGVLLSGCAVVLCVRCSSFPYASGHSGTHQPDCTQTLCTFTANCVWTQMKAEPLASSEGSREVVRTVTAVRRPEEGRSAKYTL